MTRYVNIMPLSVPDEAAETYFDCGYRVWQAICALITDFPYMGKEEVEAVKEALFHGSPLGSGLPGYEGTTADLNSNCALCHCVEDCSVCPLADGTYGDTKCGNTNATYWRAVNPLNSTTVRRKACYDIMAAHKEAIRRIDDGEAWYADEQEQDG